MTYSFLQWKAYLSSKTVPGCFSSLSNLCITATLLHLTEESEFVSDPQTFISSSWCLLNDTLENRNRNRAAISLKSMYNHLKYLNPKLKRRTQTHFFSKCVFFFFLGVEATYIKHIYMNVYQYKQHYVSKTLSASPTWKSFIFPFHKDSKNFWTGNWKEHSSNSVEAHLCYQGDHSYRLMPNPSVIRSLTRKVSRNWISALDRIKVSWSFSFFADFWPELSRTI